MNGHSKTRGHTDTARSLPKSDRVPFCTERISYLRQGQKDQVGTVVADGRDRAHSHTPSWRMSQECEVEI